jgi:hypothetical protein
MSFFNLRQLCPGLPIALWFNELEGFLSMMGQPREDSFWLYIHEPHSKYVKQFVT